MGGWSSKSYQASSQQVSGSGERRLPPSGKLLEDWDAEEVSEWFSSLVADLQKYRSNLLPDEGCIVAQWTEQYLTSKGVPAADAMRLITYRNKAMSKAMAPRPLADSGAPNSSATPEVRQAWGASEDSGKTRTHVFLQATQTVVSTSRTREGEHQQQHQQQDQLSVSVYNEASGAKKADVAPSRRESLMAMLAKGARLVKTGIQQLGPSLPFPGAEAANLVVVLLDLVDGAIANHANLLQLRQRAVAFLDILGAYHSELSNLRPPRYKGVVDDFQELLQGIIAYTRIYCERNCVMRLLTVGSDQEQFQELVASLAALSEQVMMLVAADSNARLQQLQRDIAEATQVLARTAEYQDPAAGARALVDELGGLDAVLGDEDKLQRVRIKLDVGSQVTIRVVESLLLSHLDQGPQRLIRHPDLRVFWMRQYANITEVPWFDFWEQFPVQLKDNPADIIMVDQLARLLESEPARTAFERAVERGNKECVSVWELKVAFSGDEALLPQVKRLVDSGPGSKPAPAPAPAAQPSERRGRQQQQPEAIQQSRAEGQQGAGRAGPVGGVRCQLPPLVANYTGREGEAAAVMGHLLARGSMALLAPGGMGKSCLAVDVGWRLVHSGAAASGALWVDLREASTAAEVEARFCASLGMQAEKQENTARILAALRSMTADGDTRQQQMYGGEQGSEYGGAAPARHPPLQVLLVVDNAEDALLHPDVAQALRGVLTRVLREIPSVRLLVTTRMALGLEASGLAEHAVGAIGTDSATQLIRSVAADLTAEEAARVAAACKCVPLLLCLVAEALVAGRLTLEDLGAMQDRDASEGTLDISTDSTGSTVRLVLGSLKRQHQQSAAQLAVFPSAFDDEGAAAILGLSHPQTRALLAVLHRYSVVQRSSGQQYVMHMVIRRQASEQGRGLDPSLRSRVEGRFVGWVLGLLGEWSTMYSTAQEWKLALTMAREHQADISKFFELLAAAASAEDSGAGRGGSAAASVPVPQKSFGGGGSGRPCGSASRAQLQPQTSLLPSCCWDPAEIGSAFTDNLRQMLEGLGLLGRMEAPCVALLRRLGAEALASGTDPSPPSPSPSPPQGQPQAQPQPQTQSRPQSSRQQAAQLPPVSPPNVLPVAGVLHMLAWVRVRGGRMYPEAEAHARASWQLRLRALGPEDPATIASLYILAAALGYLRRYSEAEVFNRQVLDLQLRHLGELHADTAYSINGLAVCVDKQGRFTEAESMYRRALDIRRQVLGERHPATAGSLNNLAGSIYYQGRRDEAEGLYREALALRRDVMGPEHPDTIATLANLASCTFDQGRYAEAEPLLQQTFELRERVLGRDHPDTLQSLTSLAACVEAQEGREAEVEALYRGAVRLSVQTLGRGHPATKSRLSKLGDCLVMRGKQFDAEELLLEAEAKG